MMSDTEAGNARDRQCCRSSSFAQCFAAVVCLSLFVALAFVVWFLGPNNALRHVLQWIPENPGWGWTCMYCIITSISIVTTTPIWPPLCMGAGLIFGFWWGSLANFVSIYVAALSSICIGRWFLKEPVQDCIESGDYKEVRVMMAILEDEQESIKLQVLFRFLFIPMFIRNYAPSILAIPLWKLFVSAVPHSIWISILFASLGATFKDAAELIRNGEEASWKSMKWQQLLIFCVALTVAIILSVYAWQKYKERKRREDARSLSDDQSEHIMNDAEAGNTRDRQCCRASNTNRFVAAVVCLCLIVVIAVVVWFYGPNNALRQLLRLLPQNPGWGWTCLYSLVTIISIISTAPLWPPLCMGAGLIFGFWWGALVNFVSIYVAALSSICIGRWFLKEPVQDCIESGNYNEVRAMMAILEDDQESIKLQVLFRFLFIPMFIRNYAPSVLAIPLWKLFVSAIPHSIYISILFASLGATCKDVVELIRSGEEASWKSMKWQQLLIFCVAMIVSIILSVYAWQKYTKRKSPEDTTSPTNEPAKQSVEEK